MKIWGWAAIALLFGGCGSSPNTTYYALAAVSGTLRQASLGAIEVRRPGIAGYLDRTEVLAQWDGQRLELAHNTGWAEPLAAMIGRVLAEDLSERLRGTTVFAASSDLSLQANTVVELVIRKFDLGSDGVVHLNALWSVRNAGQATTHSSALQARPTTTDTGAVVAAMSTLLGQLADEITKVLPAGRTE
ncbi:MAG TPA: PqiC family protein [Polyangiales bacterium]|nr:PqiC family protein [Polyangiales bacterium]